MGAGNDNVDAGPIFSGGAHAVVVAASNIADMKASFSNYGAPVSIISPGENVVSSWNTGDFAYNIISSTTSSACYTAGVVAYLIQRDGNVSPAAMSDKLKYWSVKSRIRGFPGNTVNVSDVHQLNAS
jgi:cerevisin